MDTSLGVPTLSNGLRACPRRASGLVQIANALSEHRGFRSSGRLTGYPHLTACCSDRSRHTVADAGLGHRDRFHLSSKIGLHWAAG